MLPPLNVRRRRASGQGLSGDAGAVLPVDVGVLVKHVFGSEAVRSTTVVPGELEG
jgi:hypothetical protein